MECPWNFPGLLHTNSLHLCPMIYLFILSLFLLSTYNEQNTNSRVMGDSRNPRSDLSSVIHVKKLRKTVVACPRIFSRKRTQVTMHCITPEDITHMLQFQPGLEQTLVPFRLLHDKQGEQTPSAPSTQHFWQGLPPSL
jgi:hypothetical protein